MTTSAPSPVPLAPEAGAEHPRRDAGLLSGATARAAWVDVVRFLAIWAVLMGHFPGAAGRLNSFVFGFHVPLFFIVSGFFAPRAADKPWWTAMKRRARGILVPFAFWSVVIVAVLALTKTTMPVGDVATWMILQAEGRRVAMPAGAMWFLPALFVMQTVYDLLLRGLRLVRLPGALWVLALLGLAFHLYFDVLVPPVSFWPWSADSSIYYFVFYALGAATFPLLKRWFEKVEESTTHRRVFLGISLFALVGAAITYLVGLAVYDLLHATAVPFGPVYVSFARNVALCFAVILGGYWLRNVTWLATLGRDTLLICCTETLMKVVIEHALSILGLPFAVNTPITAIIMASVLIYLAHRFIATPLRRRAPILVGG